MNDILKVLTITMLIASCAQSSQNETISKRIDYASYLDASPVDLAVLEKEVMQWKRKIEVEPRGFTFYEKLGSAYHKLFEKTGEIDYLNKADSSYALAQKISKGKWKVSSLLGLSSLAIKKHDFKSAVTYATMANELTEEKFGPLLMQFDAEMELGNYQMAKALLQRTKRMNSFDYLVRLAKYKDYEGNLDSAIYYMEKAKDKIKDHQTDRKLWATANLADMYGHAGRISDSYESYLSVLAIDSTYDYAMKGIAWLAYSHDGMYNEAKEILAKLQMKNKMPDYYLLLAEINEVEGKQQEARAYKHLFYLEANKPKYAGMYNKYLIEILIDKEDYSKAYELAKEEVAKRPNPATYDWLAWVLFHQGENEEAVKLYLENVEGQTYEPEAIYHMGIVYHAHGISKGQYLLEESLEASFELGPLVTKEIRSRLNDEAKI